MLGKRLIAAAFILVASTAGVASPQDDDEASRRAPTRAESRVIERILVLHDDLEALIATLPPHLQDSVREQLEDRADAAAEAAEALRAAEAVVEDEEAPLLTPPSIDTESAAPAAVAIPVAAEPTATEASAGTTAPPVGCNTLWLFDSDRDGIVGGLDRYWRHLYLWTDSNGDGAVQDDEIESAYERGASSINVALDFFARRGKAGGTGEIETADWIVLDVSGDGFDGADDGALTVDATRLARGEGPELLGADGAVLAGYQRFRAGLSLRQADGTVVALSCP